MAYFLSLSTSMHSNPKSNQSQYKPKPGKCCTSATRLGSTSNLTASRNTRSIGTSYLSYWIEDRSRCTSTAVNVRDIQCGHDYYFTIVQNKSTKFNTTLRPNSMMPNWLIWPRSSPAIFIFSSAQPMTNHLS